MELEHLLDLERDLRQQDTTTRAFLGYCLYLEGQGATGWEQRLCEEFGIDQEEIDEILEWLDYLDVATKKSHGRVNLDTQAGKELYSLVEWLFGEHDIDELARATVDNPDQVNPILNVPDETDFAVDSTIIGALVDLLAGASRSAVVLNPFYTQVGFELLQEALLGVPKRGGTLTLVTRDVCQGTGENRSYVRQLLGSLESVDRTHQLTVYEFNRTHHDTATFHAKAVIVDRQRAYIGSANMTEGSLRNAIELGAVIRGESIPPLADTIDEMLASDLFVEVDLDEV
jgi:phosphatidylserine/phosphatidylglycerophosphate/cardiolipin synthase-like enzyme